MIVATDTYICSINKHTRRIRYDKKKALEHRLIRHNYNISSDNQTIEKFL
jgi:hypothetical protein